MDEKTKLIKVNQIAICPFRAQIRRSTVHSCHITDVVKDCKWTQLHINCPLRDFNSILVQVVVPLHQLERSNTITAKTTHRVTQYGELLFEGDKNDCELFIHNNQSRSVNYALKHGGYAIKEITT